MKTILYPLLNENFSNLFFQFELSSTYFFDFIHLHSQSIFLFTFYNFSRVIHTLHIYNLKPHNMCFILFFFRNLFYALLVTNKVLRFYIIRIITSKIQTFSNNNTNENLNTTTTNLTFKPKKTYPPPSHLNTVQTTPKILQPQNNFQLASAQTLTNTGQLFNKRSSSGRKAIQPRHGVGLISPGD